MRVLEACYATDLLSLAATNKTIYNHVSVRLSHIRTFVYSLKIKSRHFVWNMKYLNLEKCGLQYSDAQVIAEAIVSGSMAALELAAVYGNPGDMSPVKVACDACGIKCPSNEEEFLEFLLVLSECQ